MAVDPRSGKYGSTHVVKDETGVLFNTLLGMKWRSGATRILGMQLLEADQVGNELQYEVDLQPRM